MPDESNINFFSAYKVKPKDSPDTLRAYLIESTAPDNIDDTTDNFTTNNDKYKDKLENINVDEKGGFLDTISDNLYEKLCDKNTDEPTLVISVHGFNNPRKVILPGFWVSFISVDKDKTIVNQDVVCVGYRWPSEGMFDPWSNIISSLPTFLRSVFLLGAFIYISLWIVHIEGESTDIKTSLLIIVLGITLFAPVALLLLRLIVYFRDNYRATAYGIPDLIEVIRQIDRTLNEKIENKGSDTGTRKVRLSFIGHSMGAYVVTGVVRILSDVFDRDTMREGLNNRNVPTQDKDRLSQIGHVFRLARLILVSPDIPAEALITSRVNFLMNSLKRFEEIYLFTNEADEVLRLISTTVNYFSLPTRSHRFGYRLGNVCLPGKPWGMSKGIEWYDLKVGAMTISEICNELGIRRPIKPIDDLATQISYFDCTDCVDQPEKCCWRGMLSFSQNGKPMKRVWYNHYLLLFRYLFPRQSRFRIDVHAGYFRSPFLSQLIYRLACLGRAKTMDVYEEEARSGEKTLNEKCIEHQVKALLTM